MLEAEELINCIEGCKLNKRAYQNKIYVSFYNYAMSICFKYCNNNEEAIEIMNDGFLKVFKEIYNYKPLSDNLASGFIAWLKRIMIYTAIDHFRKNKKNNVVDSILDVQETTLTSSDEDIIAKLSYNELLKVVQQLSPAYRMVFNLYAIEGMTHKEVAEQLNITEGTSKSNFAKAKLFLQNKLLYHYHKKTSNVS